MCAVCAAKKQALLSNKFVLHIYCEQIGSVVLLKHESFASLRFEQRGGNHS